MLKSLFAGLTAIYLSITGIFNAPKIVPPVIATSTPSDQTTATTSNAEVTVIRSATTTSAKKVDVKEKGTPTVTLKPVQTPIQIVAPSVPPVPTQPAKQQPTDVSSDEQTAISYFNTHDSCDGIPNKLLSYCVAYSINHVSDLAKQKKEEALANKAKAAAEADRLAAERAAEQKRAQDALNALIEISPITCSYVASERNLYCNNLSPQVYTITSFRLTYLASAELLSSYCSGCFSSGVVVTDKWNSRVGGGAMRDRESWGLTLLKPILGNTNLLLSNNSLVFHFEFSPNADYSIFFDSVSGRFADGTDFSPKIEMK